MNNNIWSSIYESYAPILINKQKRHMHHILKYSYHIRSTDVKYHFRIAL